MIVVVAFRPFKVFSNELERMPEFHSKSKIQVIHLPAAGFFPLEETSGMLFSPDTITAFYRFPRKHFTMK
jgi:hypothetical protein